MKKRLLALLIAIVLISSSINAIPTAKQSLEIKNFRIKNIQCLTNSLKVLVESKTQDNLKLLFKIYSNKGNINIFHGKKLKGYDAEWFSVDSSMLCIDILRIEANGYVSIGNENLIYLNTEPSFQVSTATEEISSALTQDQSAQTSTLSTSNGITYVYLNNRLVSSINTSNDQLFYSQNNINSNIIITDSSGNLVSRQEFEPYGNEIIYSFNDKDSKFKYTGKELDSTGLYYYGARYYDPSIGRFTRVDPNANSLESPYVYASDNPILNIDPSGAETIKPALYLVSDIFYKNVLRPIIIPALDFLERHQNSLDSIDFAMAAVGSPPIFKEIRATLKMMERMDEIAKFMRNAAKLIPHRISEGKIIINDYAKVKTRDFFALRESRNRLVELGHPRISIKAERVTWVTESGEEIFSLSPEKNYIPSHIAETMTSPEPNRLRFTPAEYDEMYNLIFSKGKIIESGADTVTYEYIDKAKGLKYKFVMDTTNPTVKNWPRSVVRERLPGMNANPLILNKR